MSKKHPKRGYNPKELVARPMALLVEESWVTSDSDEKFRTTLISIPNGKLNTTALIKSTLFHYNSGTILCLFVFECQRPTM
mgnify:CR=1 FL=1